MDEATILTGVTDNVLTITLNRPAKLNAWTFQMAAEMRQAIIAANADSEIDAIVITGAGRGFCAGADIEAVFSAQQHEHPPFHDEAATGDWVNLLRRSKPVVAAINGVAIGVGLSQLLPMDRLIAAEGAKFSFRFVKMGVVPELASSYYLPARVGFGAASDLMLTGRTIAANEALALRLVDQLTSAEDLLPAAHAAARAMGENPLAAIIETKALLTANMADASLDEVQAREMAALTRAYASAEHHEAIAAFLEKRPADFRAVRTQSDSR